MFPTQICYSNKSFVYNKITQYAIYHKNSIVTFKFLIAKRTGKTKVDVAS